MSSKILLPQLVSMLAALTGKPKKQAEAFLKAYFSVISETLENHDTVKIKELGTFKISRVEARKSVNISNGEDVQIPPHYKVVFTPSKTMAEKVNKEFAWLDIVEISDNVSTDELDKIEVRQTESSEAVENEKTETSDPIVAITEKQEEDSERLGEELEKDFGDIEPVEPLGPLDPDDPEPGPPIPEEKYTSSEESKDPELKEIDPQPESLVGVEEERGPLPVEAPVLTEGTVPVEVPVPIATIAESSLNESIKIDKDFDPYAMNNPEASSPATPEEPYYVTKDDIEGLATKSDFRIVAKNLKRVKASLDGIEERSRKRSRNSLIWSLVICAALMTGGFFLTYWLLWDRLSNKENAVVENLETEVKQEVEDEEYALATLTKAQLKNDSEGEKPAETEVSSLPVREETATTAPTNPSDIKAMDRVTNTRYLTTMAKEHYGNYNLWPYIYLENEGKLGHPDRIKPGTVVVIPHIEKYNIDPSNPKDIEKARKLGVEIYKKYAGNQ